MPRGPAGASSVVYDVLMRARELSGRESLVAARARVDRAKAPAQLRAALRDEAAICMKRLERLPIPQADSAPELDCRADLADGGE